MSTQPIQWELELEHYQDTGCSVHPACLECPLPQCKYDADVSNPAHYVLTQNRLRRDRELMAWWQERPGLPAWAVAQKFGITERTVFRIKAEANGR